MAKKDELRDHFAGLAMAALLLGDPPAKALSTERAPAQEIAKQAYKYADAMLKESESNQPPEDESPVEFTPLRGD